MVDASDKFLIILTSIYCPFFLFTCVSFSCLGTADAFYFKFSFNFLSDDNYCIVFSFPSVPKLRKTVLPCP